LQIGFLRLKRIFSYSEFVKVLKNEHSIRNSAHQMITACTKVSYRHLAE
jgi:hypothetical protein